MVVLEENVPPSCSKGQIKGTPLMNRYNTVVAGEHFSPSNFGILFGLVRNDGKMVSGLVYTRDHRDSNLTPNDSL